MPASTCSRATSESPLRRDLPTHPWPAVERDDRCLPLLADLGEAFDGRLTVIPDDAMAIDTDALAGGPYHIVANLPYNVGTALFTRWLEPARWPPLWRSSLRPQPRSEGLSV